MSTAINMSESNHIWIKENLVTVRKGGLPHDKFKCSKCGVRGKSYMLGVIEVDGRVKNPDSCKAAETPKKIKITNCHATGRPFNNAIPESVHDVIDPPKGSEYPNGTGGVWIMGEGEPIRILFGEYEEL